MTYVRKASQSKVIHGVFSGDVTIHKVQTVSEGFDSLASPGRPFKLGGTYYLETKGENNWTKRLARMAGDLNDLLLLSSLPPPTSARC
jgi:hypothetical protein